jgi:fructose-specific phosphotransferase system IIA component
MRGSGEEYCLRISDYLQNNLITLDVEAEDKEDAIGKTVETMKKAQAIKSGKEFFQKVMEREKLGCTAIGNGLALPHARTDHISKIVIAFTRLKHEINFGGEENQAVQMIFLLGTPLSSVGEYLKVLAQLSKLIKNEKTRKALMKASSAAQVIKVLADAES